MRVMLLLMCFALLFACGNVGEEYDCGNACDRLLAFKTAYVAEIGEPLYFELEKQLDKNQMQVEYLNDVIYVSFYKELNACGKYAGTVDLQGDSLILGTLLISDELCSSTSIDRVTYVLDNPFEQKMIIIRK